MTDSAEIVIGEIERAQLSATLTAIHRGGLGNVTRVLDPARGDVKGQLRRAGVDAPVDLVVEGDQRVVIMISAAARVAAAREILRRNGAVSTWVVARTGTLTPPLFGDLAARSRSRRASTPEAPAD